MKLRNKLIPLMSVVTASSVIAPIATSCSNTNVLPTPGTETTYEKALAWVNNYSQVTKSGTRIIRNNLARTVDFNLSTENLSLSGVGISTHYEKKTGKDQWYPVTKMNDVNFNVSTRLDIGYTLENERAAFSAVDILTLNDKSITAESPTYDRICDFIFNPFLYKTTFEDIHKLTTYNPSAFKEIFTSVEDTMYITYEISDLASLLATKEVKALLESDTPCFLPFRGEGKIKISFGFNRHGYMTYGSITGDSDNLEIYTSPTSGKYPLRPTFYGKAHGKVDYEAYIKYFNVPRISVSVDGTALADPENRDEPAVIDAPKWVNPEHYEFVEGDEYYIAFKNQSYKVLPGYGATVVIEAPNNWDIKDFSFQIDKKTYTYDEIGPKGSGEVVMSSYYNDATRSNAHTYVFYLKAPTFDLCNGNKFQIKLVTK